MGISPHLPVRFLRALPGGAREFEREHLHARIPVTNPYVCGPASHITYGTYLESIRQFILSNGNSLSAILSELGASSEVRSLDIISEKHGQDYHPARLVVHTAREKFSFVVNVAVSDEGQALLEEDFRFLGHLRRKYGAEFTPRPYFLGEQSLSVERGEEPRVTMFLAQWFDGFHEFHLSSTGAAKTPRMVLWDLDRGYEELSPQQAAQIFRRIALILTVFYDTETFEEVFPWHHASGDFVASQRSSAFDVRLITVRQYAPRTVFHEVSPENRVTALLVFLANLTIRARLDRLDGVGEVAWAGEESVTATLHGFLDGMQSKFPKDPSAARVLDSFRRMVSALSLAELAHVFQTVAESYNADSPDTPIIAVNLVDHVYQVYEALQRVFPSAS
jgi:hypothetical protein